MSSQWGSSKIFGVSWTDNIAFCFGLYYQKDVHQITLNPITLKNLALRMFGAFVGILLIVNLFLNQTLRTFLLYLRHTWMPQLILATSLRGFNLKGFYCLFAWSRSLCERRTSFCMGLISRKLCRFLCFWLALLHSVSYFFFLYRSPSSSLCKVFDSISSNIDEVLTINPSANVFAL